MGSVACLGDIDLDLVVRVDRYPRSGEEAFARETEMGVGGSAANTAVVLTRLGFRTMLLAQVGADDFGRRATGDLARLGVDVSRVATTGDDTTGMNVIVVDPDGERTMIGLRGANRTFGGVAGWEEGCDWLHLSAYALLEEPQRSSALGALAVARRLGIPFSVDVPSGVARALGPTLRPALEGAAVVAAGRRSIEAVADPVSDLAAGVGTLAITDGDRPLTLLRHDRQVRMSPPAVEVVDTTGAGDSFVAGLIASRRWDLGTGATAVAAAALGAAATLGRGAGASLSEPRALREVLDPRWWADVDPSWLEEAAAALPR
ncbi:MAG: carbohydrate kinase family protein [Actinomycetota bacterium]